jgi:hypothetical protein
MDSLETTKKELREHEAITNDDVGHLYVENFADRVSDRARVRTIVLTKPQIFVMADEEDRKGATSRSTAKKFLAAGQFLDLLSVFDGAKQSQGPKTSEKRTYAVCMALSVRIPRAELGLPTEMASRGDIESLPGQPDTPSSAISSIFIHLPTPNRLEPDRSDRLANTHHLLGFFASPTRNAIWIVLYTSTIGSHTLSQPDGSIAHQYPDIDLYYVSGFHKRKWKPRWEWQRNIAPAAGFGRVCVYAHSPGLGIESRLEHSSTDHARPGY